MAKTTRVEGVQSLDTPTGLIVGHVPPSYLGGAACCRDPRNWQATGTARPVYEPSKNPAVLRGDPYFWLGYRSACDVCCTQCGGRINAHEYRRSAV